MYRNCLVEQLQIEVVCFSLNENDAAYLQRVPLGTFVFYQWLWAGFVLSLKFESF